MATKKATRGAARPRPDKYSKKKTGYVSQSLRITVAEAKLFRAAATAKNMSIHYWMTQHLISIAKEELAK